MSFAKLGLSDNLLATLEAQNFTTATPVQQQAIPLILQGKDVLAAAQTGTGKTAAFALPILHIIGNRQAEAHRPLALILVPTRELASQVAANIEQLSNNSARSIILIGGVSVNHSWKHYRTVLKSLSPRRAAYLICTCRMPSVLITWSC